MRTIALHATLVLLALGTSACGNPGEPGEPDPSPGPVAVQSVKVTPQSIQLLAIGETTQLVATVSPANATDQAVVWESANPGVVSVDEVGLVTANAAGSGIFVTAYTHDGHHQASANVSVIP